MFVVYHHHHLHVPIHGHVLNCGVYTYKHGYNSWRGKPFDFEYKTQCMLTISQAPNSCPAHSWLTPYDIPELTQLECAQPLVVQMYPPPPLLPFKDRPATKDSQMRPDVFSLSFRNCFI